ncbi:hypothetical protein AGMMS49949_07690 [Alphaproteobacteria bacterium]|nr:hypothetical protein AGMMS49949_07660 [Alphaproteobacteria bacterium]GHS94063.1 hypothetical protein AGMMS49949_07690 [Alphaproteobacteria bacterium]GHS98328.1 hypothetical protein AGMMS50296_5920 [Alphaproteobacteria bacterium]
MFFGTTGADDFYVKDQPEATKRLKEKEDLAERRYDELKAKRISLIENIDTKGNKVRELEIERSILVEALEKS